MNHCTTPITSLNGLAESKECLQGPPPMARLKRLCSFPAPALAHAQQRRNLSPVLRSAISQRSRSTRGLAHVLAGCGEPFPDATSCHELRGSACANSYREIALHLTSPRPLSIAGAHFRCHASALGEPASLREVDRHEGEQGILPKKTKRSEQASRLVPAGTPAWGIPYCSMPNPRRDRGMLRHH